MSILVVAEHDNASLRPSTLNTVTAAAQLGDDVQVLVAGDGCAGAAEQASRVAGVTKVLRADAPELAHGLAENVAPLIAGLAPAYSHVLAPASTSGWGRRRRASSPPACATRHAARRWQPARPACRRRTRRAARRRWRGCRG